MTFKDDAVAALKAGQSADVGAANPYSGKSLVLAKLWMRGYRTMLTARIYGSPTMQPYLEARAARVAAGKPATDTG